MMVSTRGSVLRLLFWQWRYALVMTLAAIAAVLASKQGVGPLPGLPLGIVGSALGIFVSFRTNSAYDRWWEGRKLWGGMVNASRCLASQAVAYLHDDEMRARVVRRHIGYVHVLRCLLRAHDPFKDAEVQRFVGGDELTRLRGSSNLTHALVHENLRELTALVDTGKLSEFRLTSLDLTLCEVLNHQGGLERIQKTPMPPGYGFLADRLIMAFGCLFPFAVAHDLVWLSIPLNLLVGLSFALISEAGRVLENPFSMFWNGLPLHALTMTIEHNLRERLGETDLPALPVPDERGLLM